MDNPFRFTMENLPTDYDHRAAQVEAISDALQELMHEGPVKAHEGILEAIQWLNSPFPLGQWYDYHQKEALQWETLRQIVKMNSVNG
jgi:hypothetical protein